MNLTLNTICVQVHQNDFVLKHRNKMTCHGEILFVLAVFHYLGHYILSVIYDVKKQLCSLITL